ncbi:MAG: redox-sensing transcriptional repressor Rex [Candidatus Omnitrophota bacterium]
MIHKKNDGIPEPTLRRLPVYYQYIKKISQDNKSDFISCTQIAQDLHLIAIQVRKDLEYTAAQGKPKIGYCVSDLLRAIECFLGWNNTTEAILVGSGHLGAALLGYNGFKDYGLNVVAAFDNDAKKIGKEIRGKKIFSIKKMPNIIKRTNIKIGILTAPGEVAQELADLMVNAGIRAIWNFAPTKISASSEVIIQHENLASSLAVLSKHLALHIVRK